MHLCRVAWQTLASRLTRAAPFLRGHVPFRPMSSGSVTGSSGQKFIYYLIVIGAAGGGGLYAYKTVTSDNARYKKRLDNMQQRSTAEWKPKSWPPQSTCTFKSALKDPLNPPGQILEAAGWRGKTVPPTVCCLANGHHCNAPNMSTYFYFSLPR
ncbi:protein MGARP isoform X3 [Rhineura floridana]|uniref:protein MGARP isoform X3 n=1 Tax=Rhineura floridana TaxID=261503 RepID=UPI002AC81ABB|nr:protein MGARP isoform X3 [Rhineura floridana]